MVLQEEANTLLRMNLWKKKEYKTGILKLLNSKFDDIFIETYLDIVRKYNQANVFKVYPGSGLIASEIMDKKFNFLTSIKIILENNILRMQGTDLIEDHISSVNLKSTPFEAIGDSGQKNIQLTA